MLNPTPLTPARQRLLSTSEGSITDAYGRAEWLIVGGLAFAWGSSFLWMDIGLESLAPGVIAWARVVLGATTLALIPRARRPVDRTAWPHLTLLALVWMAVPMTLFPVAQQWIDSALAGMLNGGAPLVSAVWSILLLRRLPGPSQRVGLIVGFLGVATLSAPSLAGAGSRAVGTALVLLAVLLVGLAFNLAVPLQQRYGALPVILRAQGIAAVLLTPLAVAGLDDSRWSWPSVASILPLGVVGTGLAFVAFTTLVGRVGSARGSIPVYFAPPVAIVLGVLFRGDTLTVWHLVGTAMVLVGAWLTSRRDRLVVAASA